MLFLYNLLCGKIFFLKFNFSKESKNDTKNDKRQLEMNQTAFY